VKICSVDDCGRKHLARGLCSTHYNQQHQPNRHAKKPVPCGQCGTVVMKPVQSKYGARFCSLICRDIWRIEQDINPHPPLRTGQLLNKYPALPSWWERFCPIVERECAWCASGFMCNPNRPKAYCTEKCADTAARHRRRGRESALGYGEWTWSEFMRIAARFDYRCAYCGIKPDRLDPDHVVPLARGGANTTTNLLPACLMCNSDKRDLLLSEWTEDRARRGKPPLRTSWTPEDRRYFHLTHAEAA
jgi:hypothetical protein